MTESKKVIFASHKELEDQMEKATEEFVAQFGREMRGEEFDIFSLGFACGAFWIHERKERVGAN